MVYLKHGIVDFLENVRDQIEEPRTFLWTNQNRFPLTIQFTPVKREFEVITDYKLKTWSSSINVRVIIARFKVTARFNPYYVGKIIHNFLDEVKHTTNPVKYLHLEEIVNNIPGEATEGRLYNAIPRRNQRQL